MSMTDIHCPSCGHFLFQADIENLVERPASPLGRLTAGTEVAAALLEDFFGEQGRFVRTKYARVMQSTLIEGFAAWAVDRGSTPQSGSAIGRGLRELGVETARSNGQRYYVGVSDTRPPTY